MMPPRIRKVIDWIVGLSLIALGIVGGLIPVFQGWPFILAGLAVLSSHSPWARRILDRLKAAGRGIVERFRRPPGTR